MIPSTVHQIWFGGSAMPGRIPEMVSRVEEYCRLNKYLYVLWCEDSAREFADGHRDELDWSYFFEALEHRKYGSASNFFRLAVLYLLGGVYLDVDAEIVPGACFDLGERGFIGFQRADTTQDSINTAIMGCEAGHSVVKDLIDAFSGREPDGDEVWGGCTMPLDVFVRRGLDIETRFNRQQRVAGFLVYDKDVLHPYRWDESIPEHLPYRAKTIHRWTATWK